MDFSVVLKSLGLLKLSVDGNGFKISSAILSGEFNCGTSPSDGILSSSFSDEFGTEESTQFYCYVFQKTFYYDGERE
jgi:hypothetical protein